MRPLSDPDLNVTTWLAAFSGQRVGTSSYGIYNPNPEPNPNLNLTLA